MKKKIITILLGIMFVYINYIAYTIINTPDSRGSYLLASKSLPSFGLSDALFGVDTNRAKTITAPSLPQVGGIRGEGYYNEQSLPHNSGQPALSDKREFNKITYSGTLKTTELEETYERVKEKVKKYDGRIDSDNINTNSNASISFLVKKSNFYKLEEEISKIGYAKLYEKNINSVNLLSQKQNIEEQQNNLIEGVNTLENNEKEIKSNYVKNLATLNSQVNTLSREIADLKYIKNNAQNPSQEFLYEKDLQITSKQSQINLLKVQINKLTAAYNTNLTNAQSNLKQQNQFLNSNIKQENNFLDDVETVSGNIYLQKINYIDMFNVYSPINFFFVAEFVAILGGIFYFKRKKQTN